MKNRRIIITFLAKFFITYFVLLGIYSLYLKSSQQKGDVFSCDGITQVVASQAKSMLEFFGYKSETYQHQTELSMKFFVDDIYSIRVVEGCNSISIIILFLAFIIAFSGNLKHTILFGAAGVLIVYVMNVARIALLAVLLAKYPQHTYVLHSLLFPAIIYGTIFLLWVIWVNKFSNIKKVKK